MGGSCDLSGWMLGYLRPFPTSSTPTARTVPPASSWTSDCRGIDAIHLGLARDRAQRENEEALGTLRARFESLTPREREIMIQVVQGRLSKQIAYDLGISEVTVKVHRSNLMRKMSVRSLPELGRMADKLKLVSEKT